VIVPALEPAPNFDYVIVALPFFAYPAEQPLMF